MALAKTALRCRLTGVCPPARGAVVAGLARARPAPVWLVVSEDIRSAEQLADDISLFDRADGAPTIETVLLPESMPDSRDLREAFAASSERLKTLSLLRGRRVGGGSGPALAVVTTPAALIQPVPEREKFAAAEITLRRGDQRPFRAFVEELCRLDYDSEALCEVPGSYAVRGGIVDVYPVTEARPFRIDFFGDEIESIRAFDPVTQRSGEFVERIAIAATPRVRLDPAKAGLADYLPAGTSLVLIEPAALGEEFGAFGGDGAERGPVFEACACAYGLEEFDEAGPLLGGEEAPWETESLSVHRRLPGEALLAEERLAAEDDARGTFLRQVAEWKRAGYSVAFVAAKEGEEKRMREILAGDPTLAGIKPDFLRGSLNEGFRITYGGGGPIPCVLPIAPTAKGLVVVTETEVFGRRRARKSARSPSAQRAQIDQLLDFTELVEGDHVVHLQHGIAIFRGLSKLDTAQGVKEVISLEFDDRVTLHVPLSESHLVSRYVGLSKTRPQLGRIGSGRWEKVRQAAERATLDFAADLLRIQAKREAQAGHAFSADTPWQKEFEASFPFVETPDQLRAIAEAKADMERERPMDRLVCGDVGFGKTEVALRAAFKAVQDGRQVALLVPTTVLAQQHVNTFRERMAGYPIVVEMLSRFRSPAEQRRILSATAAGGVDILIGTHRLIQSDVAFKDLGLVVVDEEQRFGVRHKEVFKRMRETVDVLSMSATPIPRTLYLALTGARDLSVIETPPTDRHPIQTMVKTYDEKIVVDAVRHEIRRGGQVFYLHNRVATIARVAARLRELLPDLDIGVGHGKLGSAELEAVMTDFVAGKHQVLVCTTIIESGLDIPNCNTIIIEGADRFGLAQLYQLRGRVGRFKHQAYAYLFLHHHTRLLEVARQRLGAIRQHNQLGAGFRIAMRDLELRGAGNLLGSEQSGHIVGVGFELYCQLLRQSVARLKGEKTAALVRASVKMDFVFQGVSAETLAPAGREPAEAPHRGAKEGRRDDGFTAIKDAEDGGLPLEPVQARIPLSYIGETRLRIDVYRRLALADSLSVLSRLEEELRDRFGAFGDEVRALLLVTEIRIRAEQKGLLSVETESNRLKCLRNSRQPGDWVMEGARFPRLTAPRPLLRLREIIAYLKTLPNP